jgi:hypothetical protein
MNCFATKYAKKKQVNIIDSQSIKTPDWVANVGIMMAAK